MHSRITAAAKMSIRVKPKTPIQFDAEPSKGRASALVAAIERPTKRTADDMSSGRRTRRTMACSGPRRLRAIRGSDQQGVEAGGEAAIEELHVKQLRGEGDAQNRAKDRAEDDDRQAKFNECFAPAHLVDDERPEEVELLFDAERPEVPDVEVEGVAEPSTDGCAEGEPVEAIGVAWLMKKEEAGVVAEVGRPERPTPVPLPVRHGKEQQDHDPDKVVEREDTQGAADGEVAVAVSFSTDCRRGCL